MLRGRKRLAGSRCWRFTNVYLVPWLEGLPPWPVKFQDQRKVGVSQEDGMEWIMVGLEVGAALVIAVAVYVTTKK